MKFDQFAEWAFRAVLTGVVSLGVSSVRDLAKAVEGLKVEMAQQAIRSENQTQVIAEIKDTNKIQDERILKLEQRRN